MDSAVGTDSQDSEDLVPPGLTASEYDKAKISISKENVTTTPVPSPGSKVLSAKGIQNAKKRLRAFSIQKKTPIAAVTVPKPMSTGSATVLIGKLSSVKTTPKPEKESDGEKKPPKPPKPGCGRKNLQDSYSNLQKRTLAEIEDMKRKMELVELGIPLGLICPSATSEKAMPTKAMPPIKSFLDPSKVDELIREAKKARAAGKEFKFDYQKLLPDYDNPFQRKKEETVGTEKEKKEEDYVSSSRGERKDDKEKTDRRKSDKYDTRAYNYDKNDRRDNKDKYRQDKEKYRDDREKYREDREKYREDKEKYKAKEKEELRRPEIKRGQKETDVNLSEYLVCDSWSLDNEDRSNSSPKVDKDSKISVRHKPKQPVEMLRDNFKMKACSSLDSPVGKIERLKPVIDAFKYDIDPNEEEEALDLYEDCLAEKYCKPQVTKDNLYDSPSDLKLFEYDQDMSKECAIDANDDNFLESVINEIKQENMSDDASQDNRTGLVEYDSPKEDDDDFKLDTSQGSVTPELDERMRDMQSSQQSHYSDGYRSTESGYKSTESGYKSTESGYKSERDYKSEDSRRADDFRLSVEKEMGNTLERKISRSTMDSLEIWSFVLKICQPLLFRHDKNKCYKETCTIPKLWYATNPKACNCVKDRSVVYEELEMCKMSLVDRVYGCDQIPDALSPSSRTWYPRVGCVPVTGPVQLSSDWETDEPHRSTTPQDACLDREYQRFIESVWPEVAETNPEQSRSTTPDKSVRQESRKKKKIEDVEKDAEDKKKAKKMKLSSEGWSQESDMEEESGKTISKKIKTEKAKIRKRKHSPSLSDAENEVDSKKKKKIKKKEMKKTKTKLAKKRRVNKKIKKKLKEKLKKKRMTKIEKISDDSEKDAREKKKQIKLKKKAQAKTKKAQKKKKAKPKSSSSSSSSSTSSSSSSDSESEVEKKKVKRKALLLKKKKKRDKKRKRRESSSSTQSEDLFDVNILKNIKTERLTDDEKNQQMNDFSPRRQKPIDREIINVKELQNDFVGNNIHIKQEKEDTIKNSPLRRETFEKIEINDEQSTCEVSVKVMPRDIEIKGDSPAPMPEPLSLETVNMEEKQIPLPEEPNIAIKICDTQEKQIPLPEEPKIAMKISNTQEKEIFLPDEPKIATKTSITQEKQIPLPEEPNIAMKTSKTQEKHIIPLPEEPKITIKTSTNSQENHIPLPEEPKVAIKNSNMHEKQIPLPVEPKIAIETVNYNTITQSQNISDHAIHLPLESNIPLPAEIKVASIPEPLPQMTQENFDKETYKQTEEPQTSNYCYPDVNASHNEFYDKGLEPDSDDKFADSYEQENYEICEQMAMAYQSDVANQVSSIDSSGEAQRIETLVRRRRGEIKCDWRVGDKPATSTTELPRPSRWGLKPGEVNIVLTGGPNSEPVTATSASTTEQYPIRSILEPVYKIESLANRHDNSNSSIGYDEAYQVTYGASDRLQYGDCFAEPPPVAAPSPASVPPPSKSVKVADPRSATTTLDERIDRALRASVLGDVTKETDDVEADKDVPERGILVTKSLADRGIKRVSFADGYKPGQDSDVEEPPVTKKKKSRRYGCAWPCPASHPDHVPLWDALPPPPPPPLPPTLSTIPTLPANLPTLPANLPTLPSTLAALPTSLATALPPPMQLMRGMPRHPAGLNTDPSMTLPPFMPPEPPPGLITFQ